MDATLIEQLQAEAHEEYERLRAEAENTGQALCATVRLNGQPAYFLMPPEATEEQILETSFEIRHGRPRTSTERRLLELAEFRAAVETS